MGRRSRQRRARRAWILHAILPLVRALAERIRRARARDAYALGLRVGTWMRWFAPGRRTIRRNLEVACGRPITRRELRAFERRYYRHLGLFLVEFLRLPRITHANLAQTVHPPEGLEQIRAVYQNGQGLILVAGHAGLWEVAGHVGALAGLRLLSVAKLSGHPGVDAFVAELRQSGGQVVRDVRGSMWSMKKALDRGEAVGINVDQEARTNHTFAPFFGRPAATSSTPAQLHLKTGAPILVVTVHRSAPFRYALEVFEQIHHPPSGDREADLLAITTRINAAMERAIQKAPEQWLWSHRRWRRRPPGELDLTRNPAAPRLDLRAE